MKLFALYPAFVWLTALPSSAQAQNVTAPLGNTDIAYFTYFSDNACQDFAGIKGFLSNDPFQVLNAAANSNGEDISCVDAMACLYQPGGRSCQALEVAGDVTNVVIEIREDGVYECDESNGNLGLAECSLLDSSTCYQSSVFNCHFRVASSEQLKESLEEFIPPATKLDGLGQYGFLVYYNDDGCTDLAGLKGHVDDNPYFLRLPGPEQDYSCQNEMACFLFEEGLTCEALDFTGEPAQSLIQLDGSELYECDSSNENLGEELCDIIDPFDCKTSSVYNCNFHYRSAILFAVDPSSTLKPMPGEATFPTENSAPTAATAPAKSPQSPTTAPMPTEAPTTTSSAWTVPLLGVGFLGWMMLGTVLFC